VLAAGERQALESIAKAKEWARTIDLSVENYHETYQRHPAAGRSIGSKGARLNSAEIKWSNGSRFLALPAKPETVRGYSANLILTEFAFHDDPDELWRAIYPSISNPLRGGEKKLRIISTPNGASNKFAELWRTGKEYSRHFTNIYDAVNQGLKLDLGQLKSGLKDEEAWAQEYECQFIDGGSVLLPYELIQNCESPEASETAPQRGPRSGALFVGLDFGQKHHLTVAWVLEKAGEIFITREVLVLSNLSTPEQIEALRPLLKPARRVTVDYTGGGIGLGDYLAREFGEWKAGASGAGKIELCSFTTRLKGELFPRLRAAFERGELKIPISREIREDLHAVHRIVSRDGQIHYRSMESTDGHSDRCTALALALRATEGSVSGPRPTTVQGEPARSPDLGWARRLVLNGR
jgi:phage FluMu gp28-like protein